MGSRCGRTCAGRWYIYPVRLRFVREAPRGFWQRKGRIAPWGSPDQPLVSVKSIAA